MAQTEALGLVLVALLPSAALAQAGSVSGTVRWRGDPTGEAVVYLETERAVEAPRASDDPVIDQSRLRFRPTVVVVQPGTEVGFLNSDGILHNVFSPGLSGEEFDLGTYPSGMTRRHTFTAVGRHVILCKVHPEMAAYVVVVDTPYHTVSDGDGRFGIDGVPPGTYRLTVWRRGRPPSRGKLVVPSGGMNRLLVDVDPDGSLRLSASGRP